ncbi:hypothetical protein [Gilvibacter sp.]|uniref:hypothetical protein n=1 Tax=Gilvibacter sp. TaxID=2729997 RepID=UPI0025BD86A7|nr:hypothetical protein [Gilvibacter sp.]NQX78068.1 hypothetical protein [Gilvibacter sp.]
MSNLVNMVMAAVLNLMSPGSPALPIADQAKTIEAVVEQSAQIDCVATTIRFGTENS